LSLQDRKAIVACVVVVALQVLGAIGATIAVLLPGKSGEEKTTQPDDTMQPARLVALQEKLAVAFDDKLFNDANSAQYRDLEWLALEDPLQPDLDSIPFQTLKNQYIIVLLYYSTNGQKWKKNQYSFLSNTSVCVWNKKHEMTPIDVVVDEGVHCDPTDEEVTVVQFSKLHLYRVTCPKD
jgi:hypothetical protein